MLHAPVRESKHRKNPSPAESSREAQREFHPWFSSQLNYLHSAFGNQSVLRMLSRSAPSLQAKLTVNQPGDAFEREADRVAAQVMRMDAPGRVRRDGSAEKVQRKCAECEEEEKKTGLQKIHLIQQRAPSWSRVLVTTSARCGSIPTSKHRSQRAM